LREAATGTAVHQQQGIGIGTQVRRRRTFRGLCQSEVGIFSRADLRILKTGTLLLLRTLTVGSRLAILVLTARATWTTRAAAIAIPRTVSATISTWATLSV
jgi:hypothetical protein